MNKQKQAFTLVELIVVITILAILATIAFISFQWFARDARDSTRLSDIKVIWKALQVYETKESRYPDPTNGIAVTYTWETIWTQWTFGQDTRSDLWTIWQEILDPLTKSEYTYSLLNTKREYQIAWILEWTPVSYNSDILNQVNAAGEKAFVYISWDYNWKLAKVSKSNLTYILAVPTIINWDMSLVDIIQILLAKKLVYKWFQNLPYSYTWSILEMDWTPNLVLVNPSSAVVYSWSLTDLVDDISKQVDVLSNIQQAYSWTTTTIKDDSIATIVSEDINITTPTDSNKYLASSTLKNEAKISNITVVWQSSNSSSTPSCEELLTQDNLDLLNSLYQNEEIWVSGDVERNERYDPALITNISASEFCNTVSVIDTDTIDAITPELVAIYNSMRDLEEVRYYYDNFTTKLSLFTNLNHLSLSIYWSSSIWNEVWGLEGLRYLALRNSNINSVPSDIWNLTSLVSLDLTGNNLTSLPIEIWNLTNLAFLKLNQNSLTSLPSSIWNLVNLIRFEAYFNSLTSLPSTMWGLTNLTWLNLSYNNLTNLPTEIWDLSSLNRLYLNNNSLTSLPSTFWSLINLTNLYLNDNSLTSLPSTFWNLTNLWELYLTNNAWLISLSDFYWNTQAKYKEEDNITPDWGKVTINSAWDGSPLIITAEGDSDGDGFLDSYEVTMWTNPNDINDYPHWKDVDVNCSIDDITIWTQIWAWCNSTLWNWIEWWKKDDGSDGTILSCYDYNGTNTPLDPDCAIWSANMSSDVSAINFFNNQSWWANLNWDSEFNTIWWKLYAWDSSTSACPSWRHVPSDAELTTLENYLIANNWDANIWWMWHSDLSKDDTNNLANALKLPLTGLILDDNNWHFESAWRWDSVRLWSSTESWTTAYNRWLLFNESVIYRQAQSKAGIFSVRCIRNVGN